MTEKIEPFNKVWIDCDTNRTITLLTSVDQRYEILAYLNDYEYYTGISFNNGFGFDYITNEKRRIMSQRYCDREKIYESIEDEFFLEETRNHLKNGKYVIAAVDLFYLIKGNLCYGKYHWSHYTMITDYCEKTDTFTIFDDKNSVYVSYQISKRELLTAILEAELTPKAYVIGVKEKFTFSTITSYDIVENAYSIIRSIRTGQEKTFWKLRDCDYEGRGYMDLEALFLKEIESRQICNHRLMEYLKDYVPKESIQVLESFSEQFLNLSKSWSKIRQLLYRLYLAENHAVYLERINERTQACLNNEKKLWYEVARFFLNKCELIQIEL